MAGVIFERLLGGDRPVGVLDRILEVRPKPEVCERCFLGLQDRCSRPEGKGGLTISLEPEVDPSLGECGGGKAKVKKG